MRRVALILALLSLPIPMAAWSDTIDLTNQGGTVTFLDTGGAISIVFIRIGAYGLRWNSGAQRTFSGKREFFHGSIRGCELLVERNFVEYWFQLDVTGGGDHGAPKGEIFAGSFAGPRALVSHNHANYVVDLSGEIEGTLWNGRTVIGTTTQTIYAYTDQEPYDHKGAIRLGKTQQTVPEPRTLGLLGTGLLGIAGLIRRKIASL